MAAMGSWWRAACFAACVGLVSACGGGGGDGGPPPGGAQPPPPPPPPPPAASTAPVAVRVIDTLGRFVANAVVSSAAGTANTDAAGRTTLPVGTGGEQTVTIAKPGFAEQVKVLNLPAGATGGRLDAMLIARDPGVTMTTIEAGGTASGRHGVKVTFPTGALVDGAGRPVTGTIDMAMTPVDVADVDVGAFPGLFEGTPASGARTPIVSYGTSELVPQQNGQKLALAPGRTADIELPLYATKHQDGREVAPGDTIPLWSLDTASGLWRQEGTATVVASAQSPTGLAGRATISHFSWWNLDAIAEIAIVNLTVRTPGTTLPAGALISVTANVAPGTAPSLTASIDVAPGISRSLGVPANATSRLEAVFGQGDLFCRGQVDVTPPPDTTVDATLDLTCATLPAPRLVRPSDGTATNSSSPVSFQIVVDGPTPDLVELLADNVVVAQFGPQFFYRGFFDTSALPEGSVFLQPRVTTQGLSRTGEGVSVLIDRTPPQVFSISPPASEVVDRDTVFVVAFNDVVTAAPFTMADAVRLTVTPPGGTPVAVPIDIALDTQLARLTVRPTAALPLGAAGLSWGGLRDAAGNPVAGVVAATWDVRRALPVVDVPTDSSQFFAVAARAGVAVGVGRGPNGNLGAVRLEGDTAVALGPVINERQVSSRYDVAIAGDGTVFVAFEQRDAGGTNAEVLLRRFDAATNEWQTVIAPLAVNRAFADNNSTAPVVAVDAGNRPVVAFVRNSAFELHAFRADGNAWTPLGSFDARIFSGGLSMTLNGAGNPVVAFKRGFFGSNAEALEVAENVNGTWVAVGSVLDSVPNATAALGPPQIVMAPDGRPWVTWHRTGPDVKVARFDGAAFVPVTLDPLLQSYNGIAAMTFLDGNPVVVGGHEFGAAQVDLRRLGNGVADAPLRFGVPGLPTHLRLVPSGNTVLVAASTTSNVVRVTRVLFP